MLSVLAPVNGLKVGGLKGYWLRFRNKTITRWLSFIYGQPVEVVARGHVALAGAVVLWYLQDGFKQFILLKQSEGDGRARFVSCLGTGPHNDMGQALAAVMKNQLGEVFARTIEKRLFGADRVAAAPLFSYTDDGLGTTSPVQTLVWVVQVNPAAIDLIQTGKVAQVVVVAEFGLSSDKISPTHRTLYQSIMRHLPKGKMAKTETSPEEGVKVLEHGISRTVH
jgi:hypothetical protein